ncbi:hypothetical protein GCM10018793_24370 [Streptomyces sulfonofaciens]|uniref:Peroxidase n=1 Tax=Streptomyces sulfonofaciens TaxID=68272 RepID=A0A919KY41_9ACTN|nr:Dyp-type peroxidase [Streptomyces sulfonofaciens]GHH77112.1 hypothetical protein GCM10018793_24370 [Streptomyces sulfonofaciens]
MRGAAPLAHAQVLALDLAVPEEEAGRAVGEAHRVVTAADDGPVAAWLALGAGLVPESAARPRGLRSMPSFPGDVLDRQRSHGDLLVQVTGASAHTAARAAQRILGALPHWRVRWRAEGNRPGNRVENGRGLARNPFHFTEGYGNPGDYRAVADRVFVRAGQGEPDWAVGGSYQVVRIIRLADGLWDRDSPREQERIIGRGKDGRWLDGTPGAQRADFAADPRGRATPLDAHVRRAAPDRRHPPPLVRRSYNYDRGHGDRGLVFSCFQRDLADGFEAVQRRLRGESMAKYTLTVGGGYFFVPPQGRAWLDALFPA